MYAIRSYYGVSIIGSAILLAVTLYLTYGWNLKTHASRITSYNVCYTKLLRFTLVEDTYQPEQDKRRNNFV